MATGISCPNKASQEWKDLVEEVGEDKAYEQFIQNDFEIPPVWRQTNEEGLNQAINQFLSNIGVTVKQVREITNRDGEVIGANAMADLLYKTIQVVEGKTKVDTLPEEAAHFLVATLRGSVLYNSMYNDVHKYDIYKDVLREYSGQYGNDTVKLREEAMAKIIGSIIVDNFTDPKLQNRANGWWNAVIEYLKGVFRLGGKEELYNQIEDHAPFSEAADLILNNKIESWNYTPSRENDEFFQLNNQEQNTIVQAIENNLGRGSLSLKGERYNLTRPDGTEKPIANRVSDRIKQATEKRGFMERTPQEKISDAVRGKFGTLGHADVENILKRIIAIQDGKIVPAKTENLGAAMYKTLESYFDKFVKSFPEGTRFLPEMMVYDEKADEAGTLDLPVVLPTGELDIYDWKFQEFKGKKDSKQISQWKKENWNKQLGRYEEILKKVYGVKTVRRKRVIPIEATYENNVLTKIKLGPNEIQNFTKNTEHLKPVPMYSEMTGDERLDRLLEDLLRQKEDLQKAKPSNMTDDAKRTAFYEQRKIKLQEIEKAIQDIQLTNDIQSYVKRGTRQIKDINDTGIRNLTEEQLHNAYKNVQFYGQRLVIVLGDLAKDKTKEYNSDLNNLVAESQILQGELTNEFIRRSKETHGDDIDTPQSGTGFWTRTMRTLSQQNHPVLKAFYRLVQGSKLKTREQLTVLRNDIRDKVEALETYQRGKGITGNSIFDFMLDKTGKVVKLAAKYSPEFYRQRDEQQQKLQNGTKAEQGVALQWLRDNTIFDEERYEKAYEEHRKQSEKFFKNYDKPAEAVKRALKDFESKYGDNSTGHRNKNNYYIRPKEDFYSEGYKEIQANKPLKEFYDLFVENTQLYRKIIGQPYDARFVWNVRKDMVDSIAENGLKSFDAMGHLNDTFNFTPGLRDGNVDPQTGEATNSLPTYYLEGVESARQSTDLGRVLYMAGAMAYNYKHMAEIEDSSKSLEIILRNSEEVLTNNNGEDIVNKVTNRLQKVIGSSDTIEQYKDYMNYYIYDIKNKTKDYKINVLGREVSGLATYNFINKMFVGKALAMNPLSIVANSVGGDWNVRIIGAGKRFFDTKDYNSSLLQLGTRDKKAYSIVGFLDLLDGENTFTKSNNLSVNNLTKYATYENLFIGQKAGDYAIRNSVGLSMFKGHTVENGKVVRIKDRKKGATSLYDMLSIEDGQLKGTDVISTEELNKFRNKILKVTEDILGNNSRDDIRIANLTLMGRALMSFRSWIPRTIDSRYGELRESEDINEYELGRYRSFWNQIVTKQWAPLLLDLIKNYGTFGYSDFGNATRERAKELYREALIKNPNLKLTEEEYIEIHIANLKANTTEAIIVTAMLGMLMAVKPNPDDDKDDISAVRKYIVRQMDRNMSELLFYYNPNEFNKMLKSPIPITRAFSDMLNLMMDLPKEGIGRAIGDAEMVKEARPMRHALRIFPLLNGLENTYSMFDEDYDKGNDDNYGGKKR